MIKTYYTNIKNISLKEFNFDKISETRSKKIKKLHNETRQKQSLAAGLLIAKFFPDEEIKTGKYGKPYIKNGFEFNLAHSGDYVLLSVSGDAPVGCDIEKIKELNYSKIGKVVFHKNELKKLNSSPAPQNLFFDLWTKKESFIKCLGLGFHFNSKTLDLSSGSISVDYKNEKYFFKEYMLDGYKIMLCSPKNDFLTKMEKIKFE